MEPHNEQRIKDIEKLKLSRNNIKIQEKQKEIQQAPEAKIYPTKPYELKK